MHLYEPFLSGAPHGYFGAPQGAPCTPVEERWFRKQGATLANFILCYQKIFVPKNLSLKFMHIYTDDQVTFWLVFAFSFTSC